MSKQRTRSPLQQALLGTLRRPSVVLSFVWIALLAVTTRFPATFAPMDPAEMDLSSQYGLPSKAHLLGADNLGRDILSRLIWGGAGGLQGALTAVAVALVIGATLGLVSGYVGGWFDQAVAFYSNVLLALPGFIIVLTVAFVTGNNMVVIMIALGVIFSGAIVRLVRSSTQLARNLLYVDSARVSGLATPRILVRHILPNVTGPLVVQSFLFLSGAFLIYSSLSFLGLGFDPQSPDWGQMVLQSTKDISTHPWMMVPIGVALSVTVLAFNQIGSALRSALPQSLRESMLVDKRGRTAPVPANVPSLRTPVAEDSSAAEGALVSVRELTVSFPSPVGETAVVDRVSLHLQRGEVLGLVGESGCGKSMTALAIMGLVSNPGAISATSIAIDGVEVAASPDTARAALRGSTIAMIGQEPMVALDPCFTVQSTLVEGLRAHRDISRADAKLEALELLKKVGISRATDVLKSYPHQLSGGMAQRVAIALALTGSPKILIADEPTTALDVTIQAEILDLVLDLRESDGMSILLVTHDLGVVADVCDRVAVMYAGEIIETGAATTVLTHPTHPYTRGLLGAVPDLTAGGARLVAIPGRVPLPRDWPNGCRFYERCTVRLEACAVAPVALEDLEPGHGCRCVRAVELSTAEVQ